MNQIDSTRPSAPRSRLSRADSGLAMAIVAFSVLFYALIAAPSPQAHVEAAGETTAETFTTESFSAESFSAPSPSPTLVAFLPPSTSAGPVLSPSPVVAVDHVATRIRVPDLHIDLAVVAPPRDLGAYPKCGVAMYLADLHQPGENGATYLYAHARAGMFLPIYERAIQRLDGGPRSMLGLSVEVFTSDDLRYRYTIEEVRVHQTSLVDAANARSDELWLQTSEGPKGTVGKTQVRALAVGVEVATHRQAHPVAKPTSCG